MAGLGFKDFQVGEVLTAADVDGYLMQQSVMRFADSVARGSALGTAVGTGVPLAEGMVAYLDDVNSLSVFDGTVWRPTGAVGQVVQAVKTDSFTTSSTSFVTVTDVSVTITPSSASNKVLVLVSGIFGNTSTADGRTSLNLVRNSTAIAQSTGSSAGDQTLANLIPTAAWSDTFSIVFLDSPATTSSVTYELQAATASGKTAIIGRYFPSDARRSITSITAIEVNA